MKKIVLFPALFAMLASCTGPATHSGAPAAPASDTAAAAGTPPAPQTEGDMVRLQPLTGSGLRFDGVYDSPSGNVHYFMRFFERGNVALVAGRQAPGDPVDISSYLTENVKGGTNNIHNVPVTRRGDSLFFATMAPQGAILYAGAMHGDSLTFHKVSRVNGKEAMVNYRFRPDASKKDLP